MLNLFALTLFLYSVNLDAAPKPYVNQKGEGLSFIYSEGDFEAGLKKLQSHLKSHPDDVQANFICGLIYRDHSPSPNPAKALEYFQSAYKAFPDASVSKEISTTYFRMGDKAQAGKYLREAFKAGPQLQQSPALTAAQRQHGQAQLEKMLADLPDMKLYLKEDPEMRDWAIAAFAGADNYARTWWDGTTLSLKGASAVSRDSLLESGGFLLAIGRSLEAAPEARSNHYWSSFIFETINNKKRLRFTKIGLRVRWDRTSSESHSTQYWLAELSTYEDTYSFFLEKWGPYCERNNFAVLSDGWDSWATLHAEDVSASVNNRASEAFTVYRPDFAAFIFPASLNSFKKKGASDALIQSFEDEHQKSAEDLARALYATGKDSRLLELAAEAKSLSPCSSTLEALEYLASVRSKKVWLRTGCSKLNLGDDEDLFAYGEELSQTGKHFEAAQIMDHLAQKGAVSAMLVAADYYLSGHGVSRDLTHAHKLCESALAKGSADAGYRLAQECLWGAMGAIDPDKALAYIQKADDGTKPAYALRAWAYNMKGIRFEKLAIKNAKKGAELCDDYSRRLFEHLSQKEFISNINCGEIKTIEGRMSFGYPPVPPLRGIVLGSSGESLLIDDFEGQSLKNRLGGLWNITFDAKGLGTKVAAPETFIHNETAGHYAQLKGHFGHMRAPWPFASLSSRFDATRPADISGFKAVEFMAKGDGKSYGVALHLNQITDFAHYRAEFKAPKEWAKIRLNLDDFRQPSWGKAVPQDFEAVKALAFDPAGMNDEDFDLSIDDVTLVK